MDILTEAVGCDYFYPNFEGDNDYVQFYFGFGAATSMVYDTLHNDNQRVVNGMGSTVNRGLDGSPSPG